MNPLVKGFLWFMTGPRQMRAGLLGSIRLAYTPAECEELVSRTRLSGWRVAGNALGLIISAQKWVRHEVSIAQT
jgi:hypothetical protein